jgi:predicted N-formylglutamate amidohydrolase|tara:strand:+ start:280 stop:483 length:204 start_codon:yes stop_codon:yes gene_type:complete
MKTVTITVNKKTISDAYNQVAMLNDMGFPNFQKGEPITNLMIEVKNDLKKQKQKVSLWTKLMRYMNV